MNFETTRVGMQNSGVMSLEAFQQRAEATKQRVKTRLNEQYKLLLQQKCIVILDVVDRKLDEKDGAKVRITRKNQGIFMVDDEVVNRNAAEADVNIQNVTMEQLAEVIDQIPAYKRGNVMDNVEPYLEVWFPTIE